MSDWITTPASSNIHAFKYEDTTLSVQFRSSSIYEYYDVPSTIIESLMGTSSVGRFLNKVIKPNYKYARSLNG